MESIPSKPRCTPRKPNECPLKIDGLEDVYISYLKQSYFRGYMLVFWGVFFLKPISNLDSIMVLYSLSRRVDLRSDVSQWQPLHERNMLIFESPPTERCI